MTLPPHTAPSLRAIDHELWQLDRRRAELLAARAALFTQPSFTPPSFAPPRPSIPPTAAAPRIEWSPRRVAGLLLGLGALLLVAAAVVFALVTWGRLGAAARGGVLLGVTLGLATLPRPLVRRGLPGTADAVAVLVLALAALDVALARAALWPEAPAPYQDRHLAGVAALVLAVAGMTAGRALALPVLSAVALLVAQVAPPALLAPGTPTTWALLLATQAMVTAAALGTEAGRAGAAARGRRAGAAAALAVLVPVGAGLAGASAGGADGLAGPLPGAGALLMLAATTAGVARRVPDVPGVHEPADAVAAALAAAGIGLWLAAVLPVGVAAAATGVVLTGVLLAVRRPLPAAAAAVALAPAALGLAVVVTPLVQGLLGPFGWLEAGPASYGAARVAVSPGRGWTGDGSAPVTVVLAAAAFMLALAPVAARSVLRGLAVTGTCLATLLAPLALDLSLPAALGTELALATALLAAAVRLDRAGRVTPAVLAGGGAAAVGAHAAAWSLAGGLPTAAVLLALLVLALAGALRARATEPGWLLAAGLLAGGVAAAAAAGSSMAGQGLLVVGVATALLAPAAVLALRGRGPSATALEVAAGGLAVLALPGLATDPALLSYGLLVGGAALLLVAPLQRRLGGPVRAAAFAAAGVLLLLAALEVRLVAADVPGPEPYTVPVALVLLLAGLLARRYDPALPSDVHLPGLAVLLAPSLLASLDAPTLARSLGVGGTALLVLLAGLASRLRGPLLAGAVTLAVLGVRQVGPLAAALPRWVALAVAGSLLVALGATYEQRARDLANLRRSVRALG